MNQTRCGERELERARESPRDAEKRSRVFLLFSTLLRSLETRSGKTNGKKKNTPPASARNSSYPHIKNQNQNPLRRLVSPTHANTVPAGELSCILLYTVPAGELSCIYSFKLGA